MSNKDDIEVVNVKREYARNVITSLRGRFFTAIFYGKHDKQVHRMNGRTGVFSHLTKVKSGEVPVPSPQGATVYGQDLLNAFNVHKMDYRNVYLDGIIEIRSNKKIYRFN